MPRLMMECLSGLHYTAEFGEAWDIIVVLEIPSELLFRNIIKSDKCMCSGYDDGPSY